MDGVTVVLNRAEIAALKHEIWVKDRGLEIGDKIAEEARGLAPRKTGRGAGSIHAEAFEESSGWTTRVSWSQEAFYMRFIDDGTVHIAAQHFLELAARDQVEITGEFSFSRASAKPAKRVSRKALTTASGKFNARYYGGTKRKPKKTT